MKDESDKIPNAAAKIEQLSAAAKPTIDAIARLHEYTRSAMEQMRPALDHLAKNSATTELAKKIAKQARAIDALKLNVATPGVPKLPEISPDALRLIKAPPNPIYETNRKLESIEKRFHRIEEVAIESASIATALQTSAADFLSKFEKAAAENNQTAKRVMVVSACAVLIALLTPIAQIVYSEYWRAPIDSQTNHAIISDLKNEMSELRGGQRNMADQIAEALKNSNGGEAATLREIRDLIASQRPEKE